MEKISSCTQKSGGALRPLAVEALNEIKRLPSHILSHLDPAHGLGNRLTAGLKHGGQDRSYVDLEGQLSWVGLIYRLHLEGAVSRSAQYCVSPD